MKRAKIAFLARLFMAKLPLSCCQAREHHGTEMKVQRE
jgi:hypothetical protein